MSMLGNILKYPRLTLKYPKEPMDNSRWIGKPVIDRDVCTRCGQCVAHCPTRAIVLEAAHPIGF